MQRGEKMDELISRQDVIDITWEEPSYTDPLNILSEIRDKIKSLPLAHPKKGKWIDKGVDLYPYTDNYKLLYHLYTCDQCGGEWLDTPDFCPMCGADMRGIKE